MNESTLTQLKTLVERAVRPIRAGTTRKRKMREELLAHVSAVFDEEAKLGGDEAAALVRTSQRFGNPAELTRQLQATVPASDSASWFIEELIGFPPREPALRLAARHAFLTGVLCAVGLAIMIVVIGRWDEWLTLDRQAAILSPVYMGVLIFGASLLGHGMLQAFYGQDGRNWPRVLAIGAAAWLLVPGVTLVWCYALTGGFMSNLFEMWPLFLSGLLAPLVLLIAVRACISEIRHCEEWASLKID
jgi:ATP-dependent Clp protease ATP-binding subunit ClpC